MDSLIEAVMNSFLMIFVFAVALFCVGIAVCFVALVFFGLASLGADVWAAIVEVAG